MKALSDLLSCWYTPAKLKKKNCYFYEKVKLLECSLMHLKFHSFLVNSDKFKNTTITFNKISSYEVFYRFIDFLMTYLYKTDLYDQQNDALCSAKLLYGDHWYKLRKKVVQKQNLGVHYNLPSSSRNYVQWLRQILYDLTSRTWSSHYIRLGLGTPFFI